MFRESTRRLRPFLSVCALILAWTAAVEAAPLVPETVRVGLATDLEKVVLPCCGADLRAQAGETQVALVEPFSIEPAATGSRGTYRLQVAALKDERQALGLARRFEARFGVGEVVFDAATDLYRVRVGRFSDRSAADEAVRELAAAGRAGAFVVSEPSASVAEGLRVRQGSDAWRVRGRWVVVWSRSETGIRLPSGTYRGRLLVYLNDRGTLNLINELPLDDYVRGVVPREMGPEVYDSLEGLKAQAVAARTYAVHNFAEFAAEGYDICATPRCQVYGGRSAEHPMSDRAVRETAGEVIAFDGAAIDAKYSSTCGGHTEDAEIVFPGNEKPYLAAVPCFEAGLTELSGAKSSAFPDALIARVLGPADLALGAPSLSERLQTLAFVAGLPPPAAPLATLDRRGLARHIASWLDLALEVELFVAPPDIPYALGQAPAGWSEDDLEVATYLGSLGILDGPVDSAVSAGEVERTLLALMEMLRVVETVEGLFAKVEGGRLVVREEGVARSFEIDPGLATFRDRGGRTTGATLGMVPGDPLTVYLVEGIPAAVVQHVDPNGAAYDRSSRYSTWRRFRSDSEIGRLIEERYPGFRFRRLEVVERGRSGRVGRLRVIGEGNTVEIEGLAIRWALDLPDTFFTFKRLAPPKGVPGWLFSGRGWGHGVGMCQIGAYGMGLRGHSYREILEHYYSSVDLTTVETVSRSEYERLRQGR